MSKYSFGILLLAVILFIIFSRFVDINWDQGQHLHPDERFLTMVSTDLKWPVSLSEFLDTATSPLNPHNKNYSFYVYGTFPVFVTKYLSALLNKDNYGDLILVGRVLSGLLEVGICLLVYLVTHHLTRKKSLALLSALLYACLPTPIQLAHFYATDTWVTFFTILSFYLVIKIHRTFGNNLIMAIFLGIALGLLGASKVSGLLFLPIIALVFLVNMIKTKQYLRAIGLTLVAGLFFTLTLRLAQPYLFTGPGFFDVALNPKVLANWKELAHWNTPETTPPYGYQWIPTKALIYPALNLLFWGLGVPFSVLAIIALIYLVIHPRSFKNPIFWLSLLWCLGLFVYEGTQFAKALRYLYPMMPFLAIIVGITFGSLTGKIKSTDFRFVLRASCFVLIVWNAFAFLTIYASPHTRVQASNWMFQNIPSGATITSEIWDDGLPLTLSAAENSSRYTTLALPLYDPDSPEKWAKLSADLSRADYLILTSNRLWRSIVGLPQKFPVSAPFYDNLLHDRLGFQTVATFTRYPCLVPRSHDEGGSPLPTNVRPPVISLIPTAYCTVAMNDDGSDETFTVYDHPKVIILKNVAHFSAAALYNQITSRANWH